MPLIVSDAALLTVQLSVVLPPLVMELLAAVKLEITGGLEVDFAPPPPPQAEAIARSNTNGTKNVVAKWFWRNEKNDPDLTLLSGAFIITTILLCLFT